MSSGIYRHQRNSRINTYYQKLLCLWFSFFFFVVAVIKSTVAEASGTAAQKQAKLPDGWDLLCTAQHFPADNA